MFSAVKRKKAEIVSLFAFVLLLACCQILSAGETSYRAVVDGVGLHLTALDVRPSVGSQQWIVSGFAPGVGSFNQSVSSNSININYYWSGMTSACGTTTTATASVSTTVVTSLGLTVPIDLCWTTTSSQNSSPITQTVGVPNPSRSLSVNYKRASVTGTINGVPISTSVTGAIGFRTITP